MFKYIARTTFKFSDELLSEIGALPWPARPSTEEEIINSTADRKFGKLIYDAAYNPESLTYPVDFHYFGKMVSFTREELLEIHKQTTEYNHKFGWQSGIFMRSEIFGSTRDRIMEELPATLRELIPRPTLHVIYDRGLWPHTDSNRICSLTYSFTDSQNWTTVFWRHSDDNKEERFKNYVTGNKKIWRVPPLEKISEDFRINTEKNIFYIIDQNSYHSVHCDHYDEPRRAFLLEFESITAEELYLKMQQQGYC